MTDKHKPETSDKPTDAPVERFRPLTNGSVKDTRTGFVYEPFTVDRDDFHKDLPASNTGF